MKLMEMLLLVFDDLQTEDFISLTFEYGPGQKEQTLKNLQHRVTGLFDLFITLYQGFQLKPIVLDLELSHEPPAITPENIEQSLVIMAIEIQTQFRSIQMLLELSLDYLEDEQDPHLLKENWHKLYYTFSWSYTLLRLTLKTYFRLPQSHILNN